ncbi:formin-binding protein 1 homolog isoform X2 [Tachypleus tridentatus]|uniref:formin-binding protein 1 homolog isoform X2 n=1 Tax=Tachypleus tridentatus TaxID=6853 RepID=UPI003FD26DDB
MKWPVGVSRYCLRFQNFDRYDSIHSHTSQGIELLERYGQFVKERCSIESDYANKLRRLVKSYQPRKKGEDDSQFSSSQAFISMLNEVAEMAYQHEVTSEKLMVNIVKEAHKLTKELKDERKKFLREGQYHQGQLQNAFVMLGKDKKAYEKAFREAEKSHESYSKTESDVNLPRAEVEKAKNLAKTKKQVCDKARINYANQLQKTNEIQRIHFFEAMPQIFQSLQGVDEQRIDYLQNLLKRDANIQKEIICTVSQCLDAIVEAANIIDSKKDFTLVTERLKTGFPPPQDVPFEDFGNVGYIENDTAAQVVQTEEVETVKSTNISSGIPKKLHGLFGMFVTKHAGGDVKDDYSGLPPAQRKKKLQQKISEIHLNIQKETVVRDGLLKVKEMFTINSGLGNLESVDGQLYEHEQKLDHLQRKLQKYQDYLADADITSVTPIIQTNSNSLFDSVSETSIINPKDFKVSTPDPAVTSCSIIDGDMTVQTHEEMHTNFDSDFDSLEDSSDVPLPVIGTATALYSFDGQGEEEAEIEKYEKLFIIEVDQGDGWTRVRKVTSEEGFVPTSYIEITIHQSD